MALKIQPLSDRVLVAPQEAETKTSSGIYIPDSAKEKPKESKVVAVGTGGIDSDGNKIEFHVKAGDTVLTSQYGGAEVKFDDQEYKIYSQSEILAVIKK